MRSNGGKGKGNGKGKGGGGSIVIAHSPSMDMHHGEMHHEGFGGFGHEHGGFGGWRRRK